jgi:hypothetical protein
MRFASFDLIKADIKYLDLGTVLGYWRECEQLYAEQ